MKRYSQADKAWLVEEWEKSGKSKYAFAKELGLSCQTFSAWTREPEEAQDFVEAGGNLEAAEAGGDVRTGCALVVEHGPFRVHLPAGVTAQDLVVVVQALRQRHDGRPQRGEDLHPAWFHGFAESGSRADGPGPGPDEAGPALGECVSVLQQRTAPAESGVVGQDRFLAGGEAAGGGAVSVACEWPGSGRTGRCSAGDAAVGDRFLEGP